MTASRESREGGPEWQVLGTKAVFEPHTNEKRARTRLHFVTLDNVSSAAGCKQSLNEKFGIWS